jgi:hypothetical protein
VASAADFDRFGEGQFPFSIFVPEGFGLLITIARGFVEGVSALAKPRVHRDDELPVAVLEPKALHA